MKTQTKLLTFLFFIISTFIFSQKNFNEKLLDKKLTALQEVTKTVGFSVAIVKENEVIYSKGFGYSNLEKKIKTDENTLFAIGSSSKAFTVALLGIMEEEKGLSFNDSPKKYIPELNFYNKELNNEVTILDMISHRTGLPRHDFSWYLFPIENKDSLLARVKYHKPFTGIRKQWYYNNFMYLAQGIITEKLTNKSWEENIRERFFKPLNMSRSNLNIKELQNTTNVSKGYVLENFTTNKVIPYYNIAAISPAGSINSSAKEMSNWLKVWLNDGKFNDNQILPKKYIQKAMNPLMLVGSGIADEKFPDQHLNSYGFAWFTSSYKGHYRLEHGGNIDGFSANVALFPTDKIGIVVLTNQDSSALPTLVRNAISDEVLDLEKTDWKTYYEEKIDKLKQSQKKAKENEKSSIILNTKPSHSLIEYAGKYNHPGYGDFKIKLQNDSLFAHFTIKKMYLSHKHYDVFIPYIIEDNKLDTISDLGIYFNFQTNNLGDISSTKLKLEPTLDDIIFKRTPEEVDITKEILNKYVGLYSLSGTELKIFLKEENLMLFVPGQPEYTLTPIKENEFMIKGLTGYKARFEVNKSTLNLVLIQPNGTFTAIKK
ncbi:serine hydrolase [Polaribacter sargassicola]|uniref:serine hydrolase n=1 Tax=Polaribacter sargassicola TaxID=2836891 RepID=UPI001F1F6754|nr:serine hydrolase [Polaribacter sp. DS7-9]MCG1035918.1 beta-lactamase family protein [Polaribacter sp. DS7-9]